MAPGEFYSEPADEFTLMSSSQRKTLAIVAAVYLGFTIVAFISCLYRLCCNKRWRSVTSISIARELIKKYGATQLCLHLVRIPLCVTCILQACTARFKNLGLIYDISLVTSSYLFAVLEFVIEYERERLSMDIYSWKQTYRTFKTSTPVLSLIIILVPLAFIICKICSYLDPTNAALTTIKVLYYCQLFGLCILFVTLSVVNWTK